MEIVLKSILGGALISLGGYIYLVVGGPLGAVLFSIGLLSVVHFGALLYTGKIREFSLKKGEGIAPLPLLGVLALNIVGCLLMALIFPGDQIADAATKIATLRTDLSPISAFGRAVGCGIIMTVAVSAAKERNNLWPLLIGVPGFILAGFIHSIADGFYISVAIVRGGLLQSEQMVMVAAMWLVAVAGNFVGGMLPVWLTAYKSR